MNNMTQYSKLTEIELLYDTILRDTQLFTKLTSTSQTIKKTINFYNYCIQTIPNFEEKVKENPQFLLNFYNNKTLQKSFEFDDVKLEYEYENISDFLTLFIPNTKFYDKDKTNKTNYSFTENGDKFPNVIIDLQDTKEVGRNILMTYVWDIFDNENMNKDNTNILLNRIYRLKYEREFIIQLLFNKMTNKYWIFIFEYFGNIDSYISNFNSYYGNRVQIFDENTIDFLRLSKQEICVCVAYRDIKSELFQIYSNSLRKKKSRIFGFSNDTGIYYKQYEYTEDFLITSDLYVRNNFLSVLFLLYGLILKYVEKIYEKNNNGVLYSDFILLGLINATGIKHTSCPYCQLGFRVAKKGLIKENEPLCNGYNSKSKLIENKDIRRISNDLYLENFTKTNKSKIYDTSIHYFNLAKHKLDEVVYKIIKEVGKKGKLGIDLVLQTKFMDIIEEDLSSLKQCNFLNHDFIDSIKDYTLETKTQLIKNMYFVN